MMRTSVLSVAAAFAVMWLGTPLWAIEGGNGAEARAMLEKAIPALKHDEAEALAMFRAPNKGFVDRDLYVFCYNIKDGKVTAHINKTLLGQDIRTLKDGEGAPVGQRIFDANQAGEIRTVDYKLARPGTTNPVPKQSYITVVGNQGCGVGYYK
jgi:signal transduction histidine kinase